MIVVAGWPRSGTSLLMQTLVAGGLTPIVSKRGMAPRKINPRGVWEFAVALNHPVEATEEYVDDPTRCIKLFHRPLRILLEAGKRPTAVVFTSRDPSKVHESQEAAFPHATSVDDLVEIRRRVVEAVDASGVPSTVVLFDRLIDEPEAATRDLVAFLAPLTPVDLDAEAMAAVPDPTLAHFR